MEYSPKTWEKAEKPWKEDVCRDRYVYGDKISFRNLEKESGISRARLSKMSKNSYYDGELLDWESQRIRYHSNLKPKIDAKVAEAVSTEIAESHAEATRRHLEAIEDMHDVSARWHKYQKLVLTAEENQKTLPDRVNAAFMRLLTVGGASPHSAYTNSLVHAITLDRKVRGMDAAMDPKIIEGLANMAGYGLVPLDALDEIE